MLAGNFDWTTLGIAGAFVVGVLAGAVLTIRVVKVVIEMVKRERDNPSD